MCWHHLCGLERVWIKVWWFSIRRSIHLFQRMPFPMKIQPVDSSTSEESIGSSLLKAPVRNDLPKPAVKWRLKRLFERQFPNVLRTTGGAEQQCNKDSSGIDGEPSSVCLAKMVRSFMEETNDNKQTTTTATNCGRNRCNCLNGNCNDCDDGEFDCSSSSCDASMMIAGEACEFLKVRIVVFLRLFSDSRFHPFQISLQKSLFFFFSSLAEPCYLRECIWTKYLSWHCKNRREEQDLQEQRRLQKDRDRWTVVSWIRCFLL